MVNCWLKWSRLDISEWYRYFGGLADKIEGTVIPPTSRICSIIRYEPFGVVGLITPWNSPLLLVAYKLAPALAAGKYSGD